jgi:hypothetical protein
MVTSQIFRNVSGNEPSTPERDRASERSRSRIERLNMTSTDERRSRSRSGTPPQGAPVPQPVFVNQRNVSLGVGPNAHLRYPVPSVAGQYPQAGFYGTAAVLPQPVAEDVFGVGLGDPARYTVPYAPAQNAQAGPSHLGPPQGVDFRYPMQAQMPPLQQPEFINLGDDPPQRQMASGWGFSGPVVPSHHRTVHPVRSDPAFNNIHRGHLAHREREAAYRQTLRDEEFVSLHQTDREAGRWVIPDEEARHRRNENRRRMHLPEEPSPQLHMNMSREHEWRQQRISALEPFCLPPRSPSAPAQEMSAEDRKRQERQQRIAELRTRRKKNETRRAAAADAREQNLNQRMAQQATERAHHEHRMAQWSAQQMREQAEGHAHEEEALLRQEEAQRVQDEIRRVQARVEMVHRERDAQHLQNELRREHEETHAQRMQYEMRQAQIREQEEHQQRIQQLEAYRIQNEIRRAENIEAANEG